MDKQMLLAATVSLVVTALLIKLFAPVARRIGLLDHPEGRKIHRRPTPLIGGVAMFGGMMFGLLSLPMPLGEYRIIVTGAAALLIVGMLDDLRELSARSRFAAQILGVSLMVFAGGVELKTLGFLFSGWDARLGWLAFPVTVFAAVGVINALNMVDGVDGLAGSIMLCAMLSLLVLSGHERHSVAMPMLVVGSGAATGFLMFNGRWTRRARVFLGDAGSLSIGFVLAWLFIDLSQGEGRVMAPVTALWIFAVPLMDTVFVMIERIRLGHSPVRGGQDHIHHLFLRAGFSVNQTVLAITLVAVVCAAIGVVTEWRDTPEHWRFAGFLGLCALYYFLLQRAWASRRWLGRAVNGNLSGS